MSDETDSVEADFDDEDWQDLERVRPGGAAAQPDVTLRLSKRMMADGTSRRACAWLALRREPGEFIRAHAPRFRVQVGGQMADRIRIIEDHPRGQFECCEFKGTMRLGLGPVNLWPDELRAPVAVDWRIDGAALLLTLPPGFARPTQLRLPAPSSSPAGPSIAAAPAKRIVAPAPPVRPVSIPLGEPGPGRSALDAKRRGQR